MTDIARGWYARLRIEACRPAVLILTVVTAVAASVSALSADGRRSSAATVAFGFNGMRSLIGPVAALLLVLIIAGDAESGIDRELFLAHVSRRRQHAIAAGVGVALGLAVFAATLLLLTAEALALHGGDGAAQVAGGAPHMLVYLLGWTAIAGGLAPRMRSRTTGAASVLALTAAGQLTGRLVGYPFFVSVLRWLPQGSLNILVLNSPLPDYAPHGFSHAKALAALAAWTLAPALVRRAGLLLRDRPRYAFTRLSRAAVVLGLVGVGAAVPQPLASAVPWTLHPAWLVQKTHHSTPADLALAWLRNPHDGVPSSDQAQAEYARARTECSLLGTARLSTANDTTRPSPGWVGVFADSRRGRYRVSVQVAVLRFEPVGRSWRAVSFALIPDGCQTT